jgi:hypothetical protein
MMADAAGVPAAPPAAISSFGPATRRGTFDRYLTKNEQLRLVARPMVAGFLTWPALILSLASFVIFAIGTLITTIEINAAVNGTATVNSVLAAVTYVEISFFIAWIVGIVGTCLWGHVARWVRALLAVGVAILVPVLYFAALFANVSSVNASSINTPAQAASAINGVLWASFLEAGGLLLLLAFVVPLGLSLLVGKNSHYAITDRRVLKLTGMAGRTTREAALERIYQVSLSEGFVGGSQGVGTLLFCTVPGGEAASAISSERKGQGVAWFGVPRAAEIRQMSDEMMQVARQNVPAGPYGGMATGFGAGGAAFSQASYPPAGTVSPAPPAGPGPAYGGPRLAICTHCGTAASFSSEKGTYWCPNCNVPV